MSPLRIALTSLYLPGSSKIGVGHQVHGLANALSERGHDVTVFSPDRPGERPQYAWQPVQGGPPARLLRVPSSIRSVDLSSFDVLHGHGEDWLRSPSETPPHVRTLHGSGFSEARRIEGAVGRARMGFIGVTELLASCVADRVVGVSQATRAVYPWVDRVIPCGVDLERFGKRRVDAARSPVPSILFVGTFHNRKRGRLLWEAFQTTVRPAMPDAELWMVCDDAPPAPGVRVLGRLSDSELAERYRSAWVFCLPSSYEGFGVPYAEAMAAGLPVVATPNPGALEVLDGGEAGVLVAPDDLGSALVELLRDPGKRQALASAARRHVERYSWENVTGAYEEVYHEVVEFSRTPRSSAGGAMPRGQSRSAACSGPGTAPLARSVRPALFASSFHPHLGGVEELVRQLAHAQLAAGLTPTVHTMRWPRALPSRERWDGLEIRRHSYRSPDSGPRQAVNAIAGNGPVLAAIIRQLRRDRADLVHIQCVSHGAWFAYRAAHTLGLPVVATLQGELTMDASNIYERSPLLRHTLRILLRNADAVTACSADTLHEAEQWLGETLGDRGTVVPNGVDLHEFSIAGGDVPGRQSRMPYIAALGRHVPEKGFDVLIRAFSRAVSSAAPLPESWRLRIAGDGPMRSSLEALAEELGVAQRVDFVGRLDRAEVAMLLRGASLFVLPSRHEPFGIVNLEAMASGTPVIATDVGGVSEFVRDGANGVLVAPDDPDALCRKVLDLAGDNRLWATMSSEGLKTASQHSWAQIERRYREIYSSVERPADRRLFMT